MNSVFGNILFFIFILPFLIEIGWVIVRAVGECFKKGSRS